MNGVQLRYLPTNAAWVFTFGGDSVIRLDGENMMHRTMRDALAAARRCGLRVHPDDRERDGARIVCRPYPLARRYSREGGSRDDMVERLADACAISRKEAADVLGF